MKHLDLFSGIGGFALATEMVWGKSTEHTFCDNEPFAQAVLKKHWPNSIIHGDIKELRTPPSADLITGGFPCQPFSNAGKRRGTQDDRHLWPEMLRVIRLSAPRWVIGENVSGLLTWDGGVVLDAVIADLEAEGYQVWPFVVPAAAVDAPHRRDRVWIVAHRNELGRIYGQLKEQPAQTGAEAQRQSKPSRANVSNSSGRRLKGRSISVRQRQQKQTPGDTNGSSQRLADPDSLNAQGSYLKTPQGRKDTGRPFGLRGGAGGGYAKWPAEPLLGRVANGVPNRVDRIKSLGNAIVPQVAAQIMQAIKDIDPSL